MTSARLIAIDEPSLELAPNIIDQVYDRLIALQAQRALTLLIVAQSSARAMLFGLTAFLKRTRYGLEMRAAAENFTMARMLGVRANRVIMGAFALSGALAAAIGLILAAQTGTADIQMGSAVMLMAFIATVIGGLGSLPGAVLAGFLLGAASVVMQVVLPAEARVFRDAFVYGAVILVLIWRPQGLLSARGTKERV